MVLIHYFLSLIRALSLPCISTMIFLQWLFQCVESSPASTTIKKNYVHVRRTSLLFRTPDCNQTGLLPLTNVFLMNAWFVNILRLFGYYYSDLLMALGAKMYLILNFVLSVAYIWFGPKFRKPPDKFVATVPTSEGVDNGNNKRASCFDTKLRIYSPEEVELAPVSDHDECDSSCDSTPISELVHEWNTMSTHDRMSRPRVVKTNILMGTTGDKHSFNGFDTKFDQQSRTFVVDTGSSDHLCIDKSLYIGEIIPLTHVKLQGVGGITEAK